MSHGLQISNPSGELVVDADAMGMHYLGQASFLANTTPTNNSFVRNRVSRRYSITLPNTSALPLIMLKLQVDRWLALNYVRRSSPGSATWYVDIFSADSTMLSNSLTDMTSTASAEVHVFSTYVPAGASHGMRLYNASGDPSWDFSTGPLFVRQVMQFVERTDRTAYRNGDAIALSGGVSNPWIAPGRPHGRDNVAIGATGSHEDSEYVFQADGAGGVARTRLLTYWEAGEVGGSPYTPQPDWALPAQLLFVVDGGDYT